MIIIPKQMAKNRITAFIWVHFESMPNSTNKVQMEHSTPFETVYGCSIHERGVVLKGDAQWAQPEYKVYTNDLYKSRNFTAFFHTVENIIL